MNLKRSHLQGGGSRRRSAMTLIEVIGVLTIMAILAAVVLPVLIKQTDKVVADQEMATLQSFNDALQRTILRTRTIPSETNWAAVVGMELGIPISDVLTNSRHLRRTFLIDPGGWFTNVTPTMAYVQSYNPPAAPPVGARLMIVSSLGKELPAALATSGRPTQASYFDALWNASSGTVPSGTPWTGWGGRPDDVVVQRVNLSPLFVRLVLTYYFSTTPAYYAIDGNQNPNAVTVNTATWRDSFFLQNSVLGLYNRSSASNALDCNQVLIHDLSYVYYLDAWRNPLAGDVTLVDTNSGLFDISAIVNAFLASPPNLAWGSVQQSNTVQAFIDYMTAYTNWANFNGSSCSATNYGTAKAAWTNLMGILYNLYANPPPPQYPQ